MLMWLLACGGEIKNSEDTALENLPVILSVELDPTVIYTDSVVSVLPKAEDITQNIQYQYEWFVDDNAVQLGSQNTLSGAEHFRKGESVSVAVTPILEDVMGEVFLSEALLVRNTPPIAGEVSFSPLSPIAQQDSLQCIIAPVL